MRARLVLDEFTPVVDYGVWVRFGEFINLNARAISKRTDGGPSRRATRIKNRSGPAQMYE
jgi:hypothetical protein